jgi:uncharacterized membrane protein YedE/YeeE
MHMTEFTPFAGAIGGVLIGLSAVLLLATAGRIAGASFIFAGLFTGRFDENFFWKLLFTAGLIAGAALAGWFWFDASAIQFPSGLPMTAMSGLLVGVGVTLGNGCTSGHGICGLARFSPRSLVATLTFMAVAMVTVFMVRHVIAV